MSEKLWASLKQTTYWPPQRTRRSLCSSVERCLELRGIVVNSSMDKFQDDVEGVCNEGSAEDLYATFLPYAFSWSIGLWCFQVTAHALRSTQWHVWNGAFFIACFYNHLKVRRVESFLAIEHDWRRINPDRRKVFFIRKWAGIEGRITSSFLYLGTCIVTCIELMN